MGFIAQTHFAPSPDRYLFVDGAYLQRALEAMCQRWFGFAMPSDLDWSQVAHGYTKTFYYDCLPIQGKDELVDAFQAKLEAKTALFSRLRELQGWHVHEGVVKRSGRQTRQKEADILIAVDMLTHSYRRNMSRISFVAGDQDFRPLVEAVVREGMFIELIFDRASISRDLADAADSRRPIDPYLLHTWLPKRLQLSSPLPVRTGAPNDQAPTGVVCGIGDGTVGKIKVLCDRDSSFTLVWQDAQSPERYQAMRHADLKFLKIIFETQFGAVEWGEA